MTRLKLALDRKGQATVEYAVIGLVLLVVFLAFALLQQRVGDGLFGEHALSSASHALGEQSLGAIADVLLY